MRLQNKIQADLENDECMRMCGRAPQFTLNNIEIKLPIVTVEENESSWFLSMARHVIRIAARYGGRTFGGYVRDVMVNKEERFEDVDIQFPSLDDIHDFIEKENEA